MTKSNECKIIKARFDPEKSKLADIFSNEQAKALWSLYRSNHIVSKEGLKSLNMFCRKIIKEKKTFNNESATKFLRIVEDELCNRQYSKPSYNWIPEVVPFLTGEKTIIIEVESN